MTTQDSIDSRLFERVKTVQLLAMLEPPLAHFTFQAAQAALDTAQASASDTAGKAH